MWRLMDKENEGKKELSWHIIACSDLGLGPEWLYQTTYVTKYIKELYFLCSRSYKSLE